MRRPLVDGVDVQLELIELHVIFPIDFAVFRLEGDLCVRRHLRVIDRTGIHPRQFDLVSSAGFLYVLLRQR